MLMHENLSVFLTVHAATKLCSPHRFLTTDAVLQHLRGRPPDRDLGVFVGLVVKVRVHVSCQSKISHFHHIVLVQPVWAASSNMSECKLSHVIVDSDAVPCSQVSVNQVVLSKITYSRGHIQTHPQQVHDLQVLEHTKTWLEQRGEVIGY